VPQYLVEALAKELVRLLIDRIAEAFSELDA
jgi:hypothetical protein